MPMWLIPIVGAWLGAAVVLLGVAVWLHIRERRITARQHTDATTATAGWLSRHLSRYTATRPGGESK